MIFSTVLKSRLQIYLNRIGEIFHLIVAIVDSENRIIVKNDIFDEKLLVEKTDFKNNTIHLGGEKYFLVAITSKTNLKPDLVEKKLALLKENILIFLQNENEAQSLAQETLEKYEELNLLYEMITNLSTIFDENEICKTILDRAMEILNVASGAIILKGDHQHEFIVSRILTVDEIQGSRNIEVFVKIARHTIETEKSLLFEKNSYINQILAECAEEKPIRTILAVPINPGDKILGAIVLIGKPDGEQFSSGDLKLLSAMATYSGIAIHSNRLLVKMRATEVLQHEMKIAREIQQGLLPKTTPQIKYLETASVCLPAAEVGGDFYNISRMNDSIWEIVVADVSGHGFGAAIAMASLRSILRSEARTGCPVCEIVHNTNILMCEDGQDTGVYATLFYAQYDEIQRTLLYCNAGHQVPFLWKTSQKQVIQLKEGGLPVGLFHDEKYLSAKTELEKGDILLIYTDGLTETRNEHKKLYSDDRLLEVLKKNAHRSINEIITRILQSITEFRQSNHQKDDITLVGLKVRA